MHSKYRTVNLLKLIFFFIVLGEIIVDKWSRQYKVNLLSQHLQTLTQWVAVPTLNAKK